MKLFNFACILLGGATLFLGSCIKDKPPVNNITTDTSSSGVYIINEGNFQFGNASVSYYNIKDSAVQEDLFKPANSKSLGDVAQSMFIVGDKIYIVVNNSGKVEVVDSKKFTSQATITGLKSPRYFLQVNSVKAYVSDLYANAIAIIDLSKNEITGNIPCSGWTEEMILIDGKVFVCNKQRDKIYVVDGISDVITDSILVSYGPNSIIEDKNKKLWVLCDGNENLKIAPSLHRLNPTNLKVETTLTFSGGGPWRLKANGTKDTLYYLNNGVYALGINESTLSEKPLIDKGNRSLYGLGIDPLSGIIYVADAMDYVQKSTVYRYTSKGILINSFKSGIISGDFYFKP